MVGHERVDAERLRIRVRRGHRLGPQAVVRQAQGRDGEREQPAGSGVRPSIPVRRGFARIAVEHQAEIRPAGQAPRVPIHRRRVVCHADKGSGHALGACADRFRRLGAMMLRALARRRDRAFSRAAALRPSEFWTPLTGKKAIELARWEEIHRYYARAYDGVHGRWCSFTTPDGGCSRSRTTQSDSRHGSQSGRPPRSNSGRATDHIAQSWAKLIAP